MIITANNRTTTADYPYYLSFSQTPYRADRLRELLQGRDDWSAEDMPDVQSDQTSLHARFVADRVGRANLGNGTAPELQSLLANWDGHMAVDSAEALVYYEFCEQLIALTVRPYFNAPARVPKSSYEEMRILHEQLRQDSSLTLSDDGSWDDAIGEALERTASVLTERHGADRGRWQYGDVHPVTWRHNLGRDPERAARFNVGDFPKGGDGNTPNNATGLINKPADHGVSYRQIFDLANLNGAHIVLPPGNSGRPDSPHYNDHIHKWLDMEYFPLYIEWDDIEANSEGSLTAPSRLRGPSLRRWRGGLPEAAFEIFVCRWSAAA